VDQEATEGKWWLDWDQPDEAVVTCERDIRLIDADLADEPEDEEALAAMRYFQRHLARLRREVFMGPPLCARSFRSMWGRSSGSRQPGVCEPGGRRGAASRRAPVVWETL
jgi:hypothetical protein